MLCCKVFLDDERDQEEQEDKWMERGRMRGWKFNNVVSYVSSFLLSLFLLRKSAKLDIFFTIKGTKGSSGKEREVEGESGGLSLGSHHSA